MINSNRKLRFELLMVVTMAMILFLGEWLGLIQPVISTFEHLTQPIMVNTSRVVATIIQPLTLLKISFNSARRVQELEQQYSYALAELSELEYLQSENQELRQLLRAQKRMTPPMIIASVISRGQPSISVGQADGVKIGQPVLVARMLVGLVKATSHRQSIVNLLFQHTVEPVLVKTEHGVEGLVKGDGKNIILTEIPRTATISVGDLVMTIGQEQIPSQLIVGRIQKLIDQPSAPIREAILEQEVSFYEASMVEVLP